NRLFHISTTAGTPSALRSWSSPRRTSNPALSLSLSRNLNLNLNPILILNSLPDRNLSLNPAPPPGIATTYTSASESRTRPRQTSHFGRRGVAIGDFSRNKLHLFNKFTYYTSIYSPLHNTD